MDTQPRISYLAIASLVLGTAFYVPIMTGVLACLTGILAVRAIKASGQTLLGKGIAVTGSVLGGIHTVFWSLVLFAGLTYTIDYGYSGVVLRDGKPVRVEEAGEHYKIPFFEFVEVFPTAEIFSYESNTGKIYFASKESADFEYKVLWRVCDPIRTFTHTGVFNKSRIELRLSTLAKDQLRMAAIRKNSLIDLVAKRNGIEKVEKELEAEFKELGVCLLSFLVPLSENM